MARSQSFESNAPLRAHASPMGEDSQPHALTTPLSIEATFAESGLELRNISSSERRGSVSSTTSRQTNASSRSRIDQLAPTAAAPHGYKVVTVKRPDGIIHKVRRPLKEGEASPPRPPQKLTSMHSESSDTTPHGDNSLQVTKNNTFNIPPDQATELKSRIRRKPVATEKEMHQDDNHNHEHDQHNDSGPHNTDSSPDDQFKGARALGVLGKILIWIICLLFPLSFIALATVVFVKDGKPLPLKYNSAPSNSDPLSKAITVAASTWPIVFAAIVAQTFKMYAAYKVELGIKMVTLEQLSSSQSVSAAIKQPFVLRTFNWTTLILFFVWSLSPLAGQAILRMNHVVRSNETTLMEITYYSSMASTVPSQLNSTEWDYVTSVSDYNQTFLTPPVQIQHTILNALTSTYEKTERLAQDLYGNLRIPLAPASDKEASIDDGYHNANYSSLLGYPVRIPRNSVSTGPSNQQQTYFRMASSYFSFNCTPPARVAAYGPVMNAHNLNWDMKRTMAVSAENNTQVLPDSSDQTIMQPGPSGRLHLASADLSGGGYNSDPYAWYTSCSYRPVVVETLFSCTDIEQWATCYATWTVEVPSAENETHPLGFWFPSALQATSQGLEGQFWSMTERFLMDPYWNSHPNATNIGGLGNVTAANLSQRLGLVVNTFWAAGLSPMLYTGADDQTWDDSLTSRMDASTAMARLVYQRDIVWVLILITCSALLTGAALAAVIWENRIVGPDFLGFINPSLRRGVKLSKELSEMNGRDRLFALRECEVLLQDIKPDRPVGKIALAVKEEDSTRLILGRTYR